MSYFDRLDERARRLGIMELKLIQWTSVFFALIVAKLFPQILTISVWWFVLGAVLCVIRPAYVFYRRD